MKQIFLLLSLCFFVLNVYSVDLIDKNNSDAVLATFDCNTGKCSKIFQAPSASITVKIRDDGGNQYGIFSALVNPSGTNHHGMTSKFSGNGNITLSLTNGNYYLITMNFNNNGGNSNDAYFTVEEVTSMSVWHKDITGDDEETTTVLTQVSGTPSNYVKEDIVLANSGNLYNFAFLINGSFNNQYAGSGATFNVSIIDFNANDGSGYHANDQNEKITYTPGTNNEEVNVGIKIDDRMYEVQNTPLSLPVELTTFTAQSKTNHTELNWQTSSEINNDYFQIERASLNSDFEVIGVVSGMGTSNEIQNYSFIDNYPLTSTNYYRLKQVDFDGAFEYSEIIAADFQKASSISVYPNPVRDELNIIGLEAQETIFNLYNIDGRMIKQWLKNTNNEVQIDVHTLPRGIYFLQILNTQGKQIHEKRFIKR